MRGNVKRKYFSLEQARDPAGANAAVGKKQQHDGLAKLLAPHSWRQRWYQALFGQPEMVTQMAERDG